MNITPEKWQQSQTSTIAEAFSGELAELLETTRPSRDVINRLRQDLPIIAWRWQHTVSPVANENTPFLYWEWRKKVEKWPKGGIFTFTAEMEDAGSGQAAIHTDLDYAGFEEQPLISDIKRRLNGQVPKYNLGKDYHSAIITMAEKYAGGRLGQEMITDFLNSHFQQWLNEITQLRRVYTATAWRDHLWTLLGQANQYPRRGLSVDRFGEEIISRVRQVIPNYALLDEELELINDKRTPKKQVEETANFWRGFTDHCLLPLTLYLNLMHPVFQERDAFREDVSFYLQIAGGPVMLLTNPGATIYQTEFWKEFRGAAPSQNN